jgi:type III secretory pathway component EscV
MNKIIILLLASLVFTQVSDNAYITTESLAMVVYQALRVFISLLGVVTFMASPGFPHIIFL